MWIKSKHHNEFTGRSLLCESRIKFSISNVNWRPPQIEVSVHHCASKLLLTPREVRINTNAKANGTKYYSFQKILTHLKWNETLLIKCDPSTYSACVCWSHTLLAEVSPSPLFCGWIFPPSPQQEYHTNFCKSHVTAHNKKIYSPAILNSSPVCKSPEQEVVLKHRSRDKAVNFDLSHSCQNVKITMLHRRTHSAQHVCQVLRSVLGKLRRR